MGCWVGLPAEKWGFPSAVVCARPFGGGREGESFQPGMLPQAARPWVLGSWVPSLGEETGGCGTLQGLNQEKWCTVPVTAGIFFSPTLVCNLSRVQDIKFPL